MKKQFYGIKFPFSTENDLSLFDLNETKEESIRSQIIHIILTPKGQRLRNPNFGTNLIKYIFEPNDNYVWDNIKEEIRRQISFYLPEVIFNDIKLEHNTEEENSIYIYIDYDIEYNGIRTNNKTLVKI